MKYSNEKQKHIIMKLYLFVLLDQFDKDIIAGKKIRFNPYIDPISINMGTKNKNLIVFIPKEIQKETINEYHSIKNLLNHKNKKENENDKEKYITCDKESIKKDYTLIDTSLQIISCIIMIFIILYILSLIRKSIMKL
jgi:hypothetical protein